MKPLPHGSLLPFRCLVVDLKHQRGGFTLVEVLVVVAIVGILACLILPVTQRVQRMGFDARCINNMRQLGVGLSAYMGENDGNLPGPLVFTQSPFFEEDNTNPNHLEQHLAARLAPYLGGLTRSKYGPWMQNDAMVCPAWADATKSFDLNKSCSIIVNKYGYFGGTRIPLWGDPQATGDSKEPKKLAKIHEVETADGKRIGTSKLWAIQEVDADLAAAYPSVNAWKGFIPDHPVHPAYEEKSHSAVSSTSVPADLIKAHPRAYRNALFFDFHVGRVDLEGNPL